MAWGCSIAHAAGAHEERYERLVHSLRCVVCQNQSLADSDAPLARSMRRHIAQQVEAGESDDAIIAYWVARYGDFVRLDPPWNRYTLGLALPWVAIALGVLWWGHKARCGHD